MRMRGGGDGLDIGINQTVDFIFYNGDTVLLHPNNSVSKTQKNLTLIGTFAYGGKETKPDTLTPVSLDHAKKRCLNKLNTLGLTDISLDGMTEIDEGRFYDIIGDKRYHENARKTDVMCSPTKCPIKTQVFSMEVGDNEKHKFTKSSAGTEWVKWTDSAIFPGHEYILKELNEEGKLFTNTITDSTVSGLFEEPYDTSFAGGRRTRKRKGRKGKKSKKAKKSKKRSKKTHRRRH
jgi:hypothetical protein